MTEASTLLRASRKAAGITQKQLSSRSGIDNATISLIESGRRDPSVSKFSRLIRSAGLKIVTIPARGATAAETAEAIREDLASHDDAQAFRTWLTYNDSLLKNAKFDRLLLAAAQPATTGSRLWDTAIAAVTEHWLNVEGLPAPEWVDATDRFLDDESQLPTGARIPPRSPKNVPAAFARHRLLVDQSTLESV